ncbi:hypothetical protein HD554DRAFT_2039824 [Boletus coccyginus]|nr:hypothetical protein HD554DRAFT_2039824 [Boletus coccyginus]
MYRSSDNNQVLGLKLKERRLNAVSTKEISVLIPVYSDGEPWDKSGGTEVVGNKSADDASGILGHLVVEGKLMWQRTASTRSNVDSDAAPVHRPRWVHESPKIVRGLDLDVSEHGRCHRINRGACVGIRFQGRDKNSEGASIKRWREEIVCQEGIQSTTSRLTYKQCQIVETWEVPNLACTRDRFTIVASDEDSEHYLTALSERHSRNFRELAAGTGKDEESGVALSARCSRVSGGMQFMIQGDDFTSGTGGVSIYGERFKGYSLFGVGPSVD